MFPSDYALPDSFEEAVYSKLTELRPDFAEVNNSKGVLIHHILFAVTNNQTLPLANETIIKNLADYTFESMWDTGFGMEYHIADVDKDGEYDPDKKFVDDLTESISAGANTL